MKIRTGFVSNSSSSSFVAWGIYTDDFPNFEEVTNGDEYFDNGIQLGGQEYSLFIGITPSSMQKYYPEVKFGEIHSFVAKKLNETFGTKFTEDDICRTEQGWYDG